MRVSGGKPWTNAIPWVLALLPFVVLVAWFWNRGPGLDADDWAQYLMHAQALAEGRPYGDMPFIPSARDSAPDMQPPGLPLVLASAIALMGGFHWWAVKLTLALTALPFVLLGGLTFARTHGRHTGVAVTLMLVVAVAPLRPAGPVQIQPDLGFAGLVWGTIYLLDRPSPLTWPRAALVFLLATLAVSYRYLGAALVPTVALFALLNPRKGSGKLAVPVGVWAAGAAAVVAVAGTGVITGQVSLDPYRLVYAPLPMIGSYSGAAVESHLYPFPWDIANDAFHVASLALMVIGLVAWTRTSWRSATWLFVPVYLLTLVMAFNRSGRYVLPLYPVLVFGFLYGLRTVVSSIGFIRSRFSPPRVAAACGACIALAAGGVLMATESRAGGYLQDQPDAQDLFAYLEGVGDPALTRVVFVQPRVLAWATELHALVLPGEPPEVVLQEFEEHAVTHVVIDRLDLAPRRTEQVRAAMGAYACRFQPAHENASFEVYRFVPECAEGAS